MSGTAFGKGKTLCVLIGDVSYEYTMELMRGMNDTAKHYGTKLFYMTGKQSHLPPNDQSSEQETVSRYNSIYDYASLVGADAYIISSGSLSGLGSEEEYQRFLDRFAHAPYVLLQRENHENAAGKCSITIDNHYIFSQCIEHLIQEHGYTNIAYVSGPKQHPEARERERAYYDTMARFNLPVNEGKVVYGDLSGFVEEQVGRLLDAFPDLEAIAFANDDMAKSGYRVCESRGLRVGIDIAITGFDDFTTGQTMMPPLTTISQDAYLTGEQAVLQALKLAAGEPAQSVKLKTSLVLRNSCGCHSRGIACGLEVNTENADVYMDTVVRAMRQELSHAISKPGEAHGEASMGKLTDYIHTLASVDGNVPLDERAMDDWLAGFAAEQNSTNGLIAGLLHRYLMRMAVDMAQPGLTRFYQIILYIQGFLFQYGTRETARRMEVFRTQAWFVPEFIRDLVVIVDEDERVYLNVVNKLRGIGLQNLYICLLPEPQIRREMNRPFDADKLYLAASVTDNKAFAYPANNMPIIDQTHPLRRLKGLKSTAHMISFSIFSGDLQFGVCLCETNRETNPLMHIIGLQLGILLNFLDLKRRERMVAREIEHVQKRNEELNYLSVYDALCNVYNRRGFIEQALRLNRRNLGMRAFLVFADLDNLKKINDNYGHAAGDDALRSISEIFKNIIRSGDLIARIGGDEFVGMFIADRTNFRENFEVRMKQAISEYNRRSNKPYYVEVSIGITDFTCTQELEISQIIDKADQYLYQAKKHKRPGILK